MMSDNFTDHLKNILPTSMDHKTHYLRRTQARHHSTNRGAGFDTVHCQISVKSSKMLFNQRYLPASCEVVGALPSGQSRVPQPCSTKAPRHVQWRNLRPEYTMTSPCEGQSWSEHGWKLGQLARAEIKQDKVPLMPCWQLLQVIFEKNRRPPCLL